MRYRRKKTESEIEIEMEIEDITIDKVIYQLRLAIFGIDVY